jgi:hypothetical protein
MEMEDVDRNKLLQMAPAQMYVPDFLFATDNIQLADFSSAGVTLLPLSTPTRH